MLEHACRDKSVQDKLQNFKNTKTSIELGVLLKKVANGRKSVGWLNERLVILSHSKIGDME
jgi:hypothetical protein